jgi:glucosylceramidase
MKIYKKCLSLIPKNKRGDGIWMRCVLCSDSEQPYIFSKLDKMKHLGLLMMAYASAMISCLPVQAQKVEWVSTTESAPWVKEKRMVCDKHATANAVVVRLDDVHQTMMGFGGCFNEMGWDALKLLPENEQAKVMRRLFAPDEANFSLNRFPIGASDYANDFYSLDDSVGDFAMRHFSIERDMHTLIPYIHQAQLYQPTMRFFASPWCPPAWMKTNGNYASLPSARFNNLPPEGQSVTGTTGFKMLKGYLEAYALYFEKFLKAYGEQGIHVGDLHVQNEVIAEQIFPSCIWEPQDLALFIGDYLGPRLEHSCPSVHIWFSTLNVGDPDYMRRALSNAKAAHYIYGMGFQWDGKKAIGTIRNEFPSLHLMQTENECGGGENNWTSALHTWGLLKHYISSGAEAYAYWNFILPTPGTSHWGWVQNSMVTIDTHTHAVVFTPEYYVMRHFSHYIKPGAVLVTLNGYDDALAFKNPDGSVIVVMANQGDAPQAVQLTVGDKVVKLTLKAKSFNTIKVG